MELAYTEEQLAVQRTAREVAVRLLAPRAAARDRSGEFPLAELRELANLGLLAVTVAEEHGGVGAGTVALSLAIQEIACADASVAVAVSVTNMVADLIATRGTPAQIAHWLPRLASGELVVGAFALSEVSAGSDPAAMRTTAVKTAAGWRINGEKQWITSGDRAGLIVVWAITDPDADGHHGITAFLVDGKSPGISVTRLEDKLGLHGSSTAALTFEDVDVPEDAVLSGLGKGFGLAMMALDGGRIGIASQAVGIARGALEAAVRYATERRTFGKPIIEHQAVAFMLADAATWLDAAQLMVARAAALKEAHQPFSQQAAMAKLFASERAFAICDIALQVHGGYGYVRDFPVERTLRDVRVTRIYEGTSEIQRLVIARNLLRGHG